MSNLQSLTQALEKKKAELDKLQQEVEQAREKELTALPTQLGLESVDELIKALAPFASPRMKGLLSGNGSGGGRRAAAARPASAPAEHTGGASDAPAGRRTRAKITDEMKQQVKKLTEEGKTGAEIAEAVGISVPSVANIKKALGLTKRRGK